jgi:hypothetical protein
MHIYWKYFMSHSSVLTTANSLQSLPNLVVLKLTVEYMILQQGVK